MGGIELLDAIGTAAPNALTVIMTGFGTVETAIDAMKRGAYDYILKPFKVEEVIRVVERGLEKQRLSAENLRLTRGRVALHGERGDRGEPLARGGARDDRRCSPARAPRGPGLDVARRRRRRLLRAPAPRATPTRVFAPAAACVGHSAVGGAGYPREPAGARRPGPRHPLPKSFVDHYAVHSRPCSSKARRARASSPSRPPSRSCRSCPSR